MRLGQQGATADQRVPRVSSGSDPTLLSLTPAQGYLLSRIDGRTAISELRQIAGLPAHEVDRTLEEWSKAGLIHFGDDPSAAAPPAPAPPAGRTGAALQVDPSLDLDVEVQRQVIEFAAHLDRPYHEILGVSADADARTIKKAYFALSRVYHPDRYFRRHLGPFAAEVERCFKRLLEAYELLSDPATRREVQAGIAPPAQAEAAGPPEAVVRRGPGGAEMRRRLLRRAGRIPGPDQLRTQRKRKAKGFFESGMAAFAKGRWLEAAGNVRLAIAFDPANEAFKERFVEVQRKAHEERAKVALGQAETALDMRDYAEAFELLEEALHLRPWDAELSFRAARIAWQALGELRKAKELAAAACELEPQNALYRRTLGQIYAAAGLPSNARRELHVAIELDPNDTEARSALRAL